VSDMHENPPDDDFDSLYRRTFSRDVDGPSESVRRAVLRHAAELADSTVAEAITRLLLDERNRH